MRSGAEEVGRHIKEIPDYPKKGISYKDITPLIEDGEALHYTVNLMSSVIRGANGGIDYSMILCAEARGFVFGTALAYAEHKGVVLARKPDKLPRKTISASYELEYGTDSLEIHEDSISAGERVLVVDDLLATGGTARAMCELVENAGGEVAGVAFVIELSYLDGRENLTPYQILSLISYDDS